MSCVDELKTPLIEVKTVLMKNDAFPIYSTTCEHCLNNLHECEAFKSVIQRLMDQRILVIYHPSTVEDISTLEIPYNQAPPMLIPYDLSLITISNNPFTPMVIKVTTSFPFDDIKVVLWIYDSNVYIQGQIIQE